MIFPAVNPRRGISGRFGNDPYTFVVRNGACYVRREGKRVDPKTSAQQSMRTMWGEMKKDWSRALTEVQRQGWQAWGMKHLIATGLARSAGSAGFHAYPKVEQYRRVLEIHPGGDAPVDGLPERIIGVVQQAPDEDGTIAFRVEHGENNWNGMFLLVETTKAMPTLKRTPREWELHWGAGISSQSFLPLQQSGMQYEFRGGVDAITGGQRFGLRLRIVSSEGVPGPALRLDWLKLTSAEQAIRSPANAAAPESKPGPSAAAQASVFEPYRATRAEKIQMRRAAAARTKVKLERLHCWWEAHGKMYGMLWRPPWYDLRKRQRRRKNQ